MHNIHLMIKIIIIILEYSFRLFEETKKWILRSLVGTDEFSSIFKKRTKKQAGAIKILVTSEMHQMHNVMIIILLHIE